jgi:MFS family permease
MTSRAINSSTTNYGSLDEEPSKEGGKAAASSSKATQRWVLKILFFIVTGASGGLKKFLPVFFALRLNLSATQIGIALVVGNVVTFLSGMVWGRLADVTGRYKAIMLVTAAFGAVINFGLLTTTITNSFWLLNCVYGLSTFFTSAWSTLVDAVAVIGSDPGGGYGKIRLWSAAGWGTLSITTGVMVDYVGIGYIFAIFAFWMGLGSALVAYYFQDPQTDHHRRKAKPPSSSNKHLSLEEAKVQSGDDTNAAEKQDPPAGKAVTLTEVLQQKGVLLLLTNLFIQGTLLGFVESFLYVYLAQIYHAPVYFMGLCTFVASICECPVFYYSEQLLARVGIKGLLTISQWCYATRVWIYTIIPVSHGGYWPFLLTEPSHAFVVAGM